MSAPLAALPYAPSSEPFPPRVITRYRSPAGASRVMRTMR